MEIKFINCLKLFLGLFITSCIVWFLVPFIDFDNELCLIGCTSSWIGLVLSFFVTLQLRKGKVSLDHFNHRTIPLLCGLFSISFGSWFLSLVTVPDNICFLLGANSSGFGVIILLYLLYTLRNIPKDDEEKKLLE